jgi:hypothetical protein
VRHPQGRRTKNAPEDETDLMPQIGFLFSHLLRDQPPTKKSRNMTTLTQLPGLRVRGENPNHHLWNNHGTWFLHYTVHPTPFTKERIRRSLGTKDLAAARERRDRFFQQLAAESVPAGAVGRKQFAA